MIPKLRYSWDNMKIGRLSLHNYEQRFIIIEGLLQKNKNSNFAFYFLALCSITLIGCNNDNKENETNSRVDSLIQINPLEDSTEANENTYQKHYSLDSTVSDSLSHISITPPGCQPFPIDPFEDDTIPTLVEVMPEFIGGIDSLNSYLKSNINYPRWEINNKIDGTVYVSFIIDKEGIVTRPKIVRSVEDSKNFNKEVLRVISSMPRWTPGVNKGQKVATRKTLPINFRLK